MIRDDTFISLAVYIYIITPTEALIPSLASSLLKRRIITDSHRHHFVAVRVAVKVRLLDRPKVGARATVRVRVRARVRVRGLGQQ